MSDVTAPVEIPKGDAIATELDVLPRGESQWGIIFREFRKRKTALVCYGLLVLLAAACIYAPFLANDRPIAYLGYNRGEYERSRQTVRALVGQLIAPPVDESGKPIPVDEAGHRQSIRDRLATMQDQVVPDDAARIREFAESFSQAVAAEPVDAAELERLRTALRDLSARDVEFSMRWRFPVAASLDGVDLGFMTLALLFFTAPLWRIVLRRRYGHGNPRVNRISLAVILSLPLLAGLAWRLAVPERTDLTQYKEGVLASADESLVERASAIYEAVLWPPIPYGVDENILEEKLSPPAWWWGEEQHAEEDESVAPYPNGLPSRPPHLLGTDALGRDIGCRMVWGGRISLAVGVVAVSIYVVIGILVGAVAGYFRGGVDMVISRIIEIVICFPSFFLILAIVAFVGPGMFNIMVVIGLTSWTGVARLVRAEFLRLGEQEFVLAGRALGYSAPRIIFRHVLPNAMAPVLVSATFGVAGAILIESGLSFLGLGITVPTPSWGSILSDGRAQIFSAEWIILFPGLAIFLTITFYNLVGEAFRDAADPRLRGSR